MSPDYANDVRAFMRLQGRELPDRPRDLAPADNLALREAQSLTKAAEAMLKQGGGPPMLGPRLIVSELREYLDALLEGDVVEAADALGDLLYVVHWNALDLGIDIGPVFVEIQRANLSKTVVCYDCAGTGRVALEPAGLSGAPVNCPTCCGLGRVTLRDAQGKVQKPPGWTPPDIAGALAKQRTRALPSEREGEPIQWAVKTHPPDCQVCSDPDPDEESGEVLEVCGKLMGSGGPDHWTGDLKPRLESELGDLLAAVDFVLAVNPQLDSDVVENRRREKLSLFHRWHRGQT